VVVVDVAPVERVERALVAHLRLSANPSARANRVVVADALAALAAKPTADATTDLVAVK
jgi:hypothetical protein